MSDRTPTDEQSHILDLARNTEDNLLISALAGCGKTTMLEMIERAVKAKPILYLCFNKKIADDASKRMLSTTTVRTFNSLGHRIWAAYCSHPLALDPKKSANILREIINETPKRDAQPIWDSFWEIVNGVALAKSLGYIPEGKFPGKKSLLSASAFHASLDESPDDLTADLIDAVLTRSITAAYSGRIDYNDQVYMPALFGGTFPRFPLVKVDEIQDLNPINHALLNKLVKQRLIAVGDPWQSIYGFRGAVQGGMATLQAKFSMTGAPLSASFRCPRAVVEAARWRVPHFKWIKEGGHVAYLQHLEASDIADNAAIICRNNAPLFQLALRLLSRGRSVRMAGSDIGPKLIGLLRKLGPADLSRSATLSAIEEWRELRKDKGSTTADDMAECMTIFAEAGDSLAQAIAYAEHVLSQQGSIQLLTGHKAKGLEFETVFHLDPWLCREDEQDLNLRYVITTRSLNTLYEINSRDIRW